MLKKVLFSQFLLVFALFVMSVGTTQQCGIFATVWRDEDHNLNITSFKLWHSLEKVR